MILKLNKSIFKLNDNYILHKEYNKINYKLRKITY